MNYRVVSDGKYWGIDKWIEPFKIFGFTILHGYWEPIIDYLDYYRNRTLFDSKEDAEQHIKDMQTDVKEFVEI